MQVSNRISKGNGVASGKGPGRRHHGRTRRRHSGYAAGIGIMCHAVAKSNEELKALIINASAISAPVSLYLLGTANW